jgi:ABC-type branched-subunit amino acid transport system substrate-binding protein
MPDAAPKGCGAVGERDLTLAGPISLSGRYARQGRSAAAGLEQAVEDARRAGHSLQLALLDDRSTREGVRRVLDAVARADLVVGPYGSDLGGEAARWAGERGRVLWNHGASADDVQRLPGVVSVASPASGYLATVLDAVAGRLHGRARVLVAAGRGAFGHTVAAGAREAASRLGMTVVGVLAHPDVPDEPDVDVLLAAGSFVDDVTLVRRLRRRPPVLAAVAGGLGEFAEAAGPHAERVLAPSQWEEGLRTHRDLGPSAGEVVRGLRARLLPCLLGAGLGHVEYPAAQAYASVLVALRCVQEAGAVNDNGLLAVAQGLRCTTFFGRFGLSPDGRQHDHEIEVVQWRQGAKRVVWPPPAAHTNIAVGP